ncbi:hypothetical protein DsansV1_C21g0169431 [Dioscorea sansibarensis]
MYMSPIGILGPFGHPKRGRERPTVPTGGYVDNLRHWKSLRDEPQHERERKTNPDRRSMFAEGIIVHLKRGFACRTRES